MPTTNKYGKEGAANKAIGGIPTMHYLDFQSRGRGQVVRLLWEDAGIAYEDIVRARRIFKGSMQQLTIAALFVRRIPTGQA